MGERKMQRKAAEFAQAHGLGMEPCARFLDLSSELGELAKELLKGSDYGAKPLVPTGEMEEELGDCLFSLLVLAQALGLDAEQALDRVLEKYERRHAETGGVGSGR